LELGLGSKEEVLLTLTLLISVITLGTGRTTVLQGIVHLVIFAAFVFFAVGAKSSRATPRSRLLTLNKAKERPNRPLARDDGPLGAKSKYCRTAL
jgi:Ca2+/Na+ antiporter